jgi:hypothetical protein
MLERGVVVRLDPRMTGVPRGPSPRTPPTKRQQQLASAVAAAGGGLTLPPEELVRWLNLKIAATDLGAPGDARTYLERQLARAQLVASYNPVGSITVSTSDTPATLHLPWLAPQIDPTQAPPIQPAAPAMTSEQLGKRLYGVATFLATFAPAVGYAWMPGGELKDAKETFFSVYLATLPLSLALTAVILLYKRHALESDTQRLWASCAILIASGVIGIGIGSSQTDEAAFSGLHGPLPYMVVAVAVYVIFSYAAYYGLVLFIAAAATSWVAALWVNEKLGGQQ